MKTQNKGTGFLYLWSCVFIGSIFLAIVLALIIGYRLNLHYILFK